MLKTVSQKLCDRKVLASVLCMLMVLPMATFCKAPPTAESVMSGVISIIFKIAFYVGTVLCISGIFQLIMAYKDDNADGQSRAVRLVVVSLALLSLETLVTLTGLI